MFTMILRRILYKLSLQYFLFKNWKRKEKFRDFFTLADKIKGQIYPEKGWAGPRIQTSKLDEGYFTVELARL